MNGPEIRKSLQTITWGDPQHHLFDHIFQQAAGAGFDGVEIGFRRLGQVSIDDARGLLDKHGLGLSASHVGGNLVDLTQATNERAALDEVLTYLVELGAEFLIYSGLNVTTEAELTAELSQLGGYADRCAQKGIRLLYHNHDWEFRNERSIWRRLLGQNIETLGFAPDLGWAVKGGHAMRDLLDEIGGAVEVLHFKDFLSWEDGQNTCHLGSGVVDFSPAWDWLGAVERDGIWVVAEQDNATDNDAACVANGAYLSQHVDGLGR